MRGTCSREQRRTNTFKTKSVSLYLTHLSMKRDGGDAEVPQHQRHPLGVVARAAENNEGVTRQLVQDGHQVTVLHRKNFFKSTRLINTNVKRRSENLHHLISSHLLRNTLPCIWKVWRCSTAAACPLWSILWILHILQDLSELLSLVSAPVRPKKVHECWKPLTDAATSLLQVRFTTCKSHTAWSVENNPPTFLVMVAENKKVRLSLGITFKILSTWKNKFREE